MLLRGRFFLLVLDAVAVNIFLDLRRDSFRGFLIVVPRFGLSLKAQFVWLWVDGVSPHS